MPAYLVSIGRLINFSASSTNQLCNKLLGKSDLSLAQWVILSALWRKEGMTISNLSEYSRTNIPAVSRLVDRMEANGLVIRRHSDEDQRSVQVFLTEKSQSMAGLINFYKDVNDIMTQGFDDHEKEQFIALLERVNTNLENAIK